MPGGGIYEGLDGELFWGDGLSMEDSDMPEPTDRELDCFIAEKMMGWKHIVEDCYGVGIPGGYPPKHEGQRQVVPRYSTDRNAAAQVLERIAELGLWINVLEHFRGLIAQNTDTYFQWQCVTATPRQLMLAAKAAFGERAAGICNHCHHRVEYHSGTGCLVGARTASACTCPMNVKQLQKQAERAALEGGEKTNARTHHPD